MYIIPHKILADLFVNGKPMKLSKNRSDVIKKRRKKEEKNGCPYRFVLESLVLRTPRRDPDADLKKREEICLLRRPERQRGYFPELSRMRQRKDFGRSICEREANEAV